MDKNELDSETFLLLDEKNTYCKNIHRPQVALCVC